MRTSIFLSIAQSLALGLAFTLHTAAVPVQALDLEQLQQRHDRGNTADVNVNQGAEAAAATEYEVAPTKSAILIPCPTNWNPHYGRGPVCSKTAGTAREVEKKKPQPLDFGLGP